MSEAAHGASSSRRGPAEKQKAPHWRERVRDFLQATYLRPSRDAEAELFGRTSISLVADTRGSPELQRTCDRRFRKMRAAEDPRRDHEPGLAPRPRKRGGDRRSQKHWLESRAGHCGENRSARLTSTGIARCTCSTAGTASAPRLRVARSRQMAVRFSEQRRMTGARPITPASIRPGCSRQERPGRRN